MPGMREKRSTLAAVAAVGMFLAQAAGCGGCVKDDPTPAAGTEGTRPPVNMKAIDKRLSQFSTIDGSVAPAADASTD